MDFLGIFTDLGPLWGARDIQMEPFELPKRRKIRSGRVSKCAWYPRWVPRVPGAHFWVHFGRTFDGFCPTFRLILDDFWRWILECFWGETRNAQKSSWGETHNYVSTSGCLPTSAFNVYWRAPLSFPVLASTGTIYYILSNCLRHTGHRA